VATTTTPTTGIDLYGLVGVATTTHEELCIEHGSLSQNGVATKNFFAGSSLFEPR
jgi:hypothetical protein